MHVAIVDRGPRGRTLPEHGDLPVEAQHRTPHVGLVQQRRRVVGEVAGGEVVAAVDHEIVGAEECEGIISFEAHRMLDDDDVAIDLADRPRRTARLQLADRCCAMNHLTLQVAHIDRIEVDDSDRADAGRREVLQHGRTQTTGPDDQYPRRRQPALPVETELRQRDVAREPVEPFQRHLDRLDQRGQSGQRGQRHGD